MRTKEEIESKSMNFYLCIEEKEEDILAEEEITIEVPENMTTQEVLAVFTSLFKVRRA